MSTALTILPLLLVAAAALTVKASAAAVEALPGCQDSCGGTAIRYPFGIGAGCFRPGFQIICDGGTTPVLSGTRPVPVSNFSISTAEALVMLPVAWECYNSSDDVYDWEYGDVQFNKDGVYRISNARNQVVVVGCNTLGYTQSQRSEGSDYTYAYYTGCMCFCNNSGSATDAVCAGVGCCHVDFPSGLTNNYMNFIPYTHKARLDFAPCDYAFFVDRNNYTFHTTDLKMDRNRTMPVWLDWAIRDNALTCEEAKKGQGHDYACVSSNSECYNSSNGPGYVCNCSMGYDGNPYVTNGCSDINECEHPGRYPCFGNCHNTKGSYECTCPSGTHSGDPFKEPCSSNFPLPAQISIGLVGGLFIIALLVFIILIRNEKRKMMEFFKKNGGPTLEKAKNIKIYKKEELNPILKRSNFIGKGGFGEVYKGFLDNQLVVVKKPIAVTKPADGNMDLQNKQFANEVIIQSQVIHKNIVKLIGCCLEVDKPMLVFEFLSKGSLDDILHGSNCAPVTLERRLNIAAESAEGIAYLHSKTTNVILHGDVKPANILLDDSFTPKISDFGISRLIVIDKDHMDFVISDKTYMDPVYLQDRLLTDKSDVYSFGVVLLELISRKKATYVDNNSLVKNFLDAHKSQREATELFDKEIAKPEVLKLLNSLFEIAVNCLNLDVDKRPNMTEVAENLLMLKRSWSNTLTSHVPIS